MIAPNHPHRAAVARALSLLDAPTPQVEEAKAILRLLMDESEELVALQQPQPLTAEQRVFLDEHRGVQALIAQMATEDGDEEYFEANPDGSPSDRIAS